MTAFVLGVAFGMALNIAIQLYMHHRQRSLS